MELEEAIKMDLRELFEKVYYGKIKKRRCNCSAYKRI